MNANDQNIIYTFYKLGPSFITWFYPIDQTPIEKEILDPMGQIGTEDFEDFPGAIEHLKPFDPDWFLKKENELVCQLLIENLVYLSDVFGMNGAYSLQAALAKDPDESIFRYRLGALGGNPECMVGYGQMMCRKGYVTDGWEWIEKGAEKGCEMGMLLAAMSAIDYEKAAYFYRRAIKEFHSFYAFMNYGVMLVEANCCHSALYTMGHAMKQKDNFINLLKDKDATNLLSNIESCEALLQLPYEERPKHIAIEYHAPELDGKFCYKGESPKTVGANGQKPNPWYPEDNRLVPTDVEERNAYQAKIKAREVIMEIDEKYRIFLKYDDGTPIAEVKMPALKIQLVGFGTFETSERAARTGINPRTKQAIKIPASKYVSFSAAKAIKDTLLDYEESIKAFSPLGSKGEIYTVCADRERIRWTT